jgi:rod shape-determining protein MreC
VAVGDLGGRVRVDRFITDESVEVGALVETSSFGGLFPRGLLVGVVEEVLPQDPNELRRSFRVVPAVDLATLTDVVLFTPQ